MVQQKESDTALKSINTILHQIRKIKRSILTCQTEYKHCFVKGEERNL